MMIKRKPKHLPELLLVTNTQNRLW